MSAEQCPVCRGAGVIYGIAETGAQPTQTCHGCGGKGWVRGCNCGLCTPWPPCYPYDSFYVSEPCTNLPIISVSSEIHYRLLTDQTEGMNVPGWKVA